jgi:uncharacterized membrane protein SpoIIM required for sporulation
VNAVLLQDLVPILQTAVGPVILISGVGLIVLSLTNRYARVFDRTHYISQRLSQVPKEEYANLASQLKYLLKQARMIRMSLTLAALSVFFTALMVATIFICAFWQLGFPNIIAGLFIACMICLIGALIYFLADINMSLKTLKLEVKSLKDEK